jgi:hypothetical protein
MIVLHAASLDELDADDGRRAALGLHVLPPGIARPKPRPVPVEPQPVEVDLTSELAETPDS